MNIPSLSRWRCLVPALIALACSGCYNRYVVREGQPTALLQSHMDADSQHVNMYTYWTTTFRDLSCAAPQRLQTKMFAGNSYTSPPFPIAANSTFVVSTTYMDARFAQNRACIATATFNPEAGRRYRSDMLVRGDATTCELKIVDVTSGADQPAAYQTPDQACPEGGPPLPHNGQSTLTNYQIQVQYQSAPSKK